MEAVDDWKLMWSKLHTHTPAPQRYTSHPHRFRVNVIQDTSVVVFLKLLLQESSETVFSIICKLNIMLKYKKVMP